MHTEIEQIARQVQGMTAVTVYFPDTRPESIVLTRQGDTAWIRPEWTADKILPGGLATELAAQFTGEQKFNTDPEVIRSALGYDEFMDRYYNKLGS